MNLANEIVGKPIVDEKTSRTELVSVEMKVTRKAPINEVIPN